MLKPGPGQHYYLYQPLKFKGWENHPFTLGAYEPLDSPPATQTAAADTPEVTTKEIHVGGVDSSSHDNASSSSSSGVVAPLATQHKQTHFENAIGQQKFIFLVRPFGSWTKRLRAECLKSPTGVITPSIFIEGPYGERSPLHTYENVVFIVGGTGISGALPYLQEHIQRTDSSADTTATTTSALTTRATASTTRTRDITFVWSAKQAAMIRNVAARELQPMLGRDDIHVHLHATSSSSRKTAMNVSEAQGKNSNDSDTADAAAAADDKEIKTTTASATTTTASSLNNDGLTITHGRPNIREAILNVVNEVHAAGTAGGRIAILTCGPAGMADEARAAVHTALKQGMREVEYIEETFG